MKRNNGIITILVGVGILFISIFFSSGYLPKLNFIGNISRTEIVLKNGGLYGIDKIINDWSQDPEFAALPRERKQRIVGNYFDTYVADDEFRRFEPDKQARIKNNFLAKYSEYKGRVAIPLKYPLSLSVIFILLGTWIVLISKDKKTNA